MKKVWAWLLVVVLALQSLTFADEILLEDISQDISQDYYQAFLEENDRDEQQTETGFWEMEEGDLFSEDSIVSSLEDSESGEGGGTPAEVEILSDDTLEDIFEETVFDTEETVPEEALTEGYEALLEETISEVPGEISEEIVEEPSDQADTAFNGSISGIKMLGDGGSTFQGISGSIYRGEIYGSVAGNYIFYVTLENNPNNSYRENNLYHIIRYDVGSGISIVLDTVTGCLNGIDFFFINDRLYSIEQMYSMSGDGSQCIVYCTDLLTGASSVALDVILENDAACRAVLETVPAVILSALFFVIGNVMGFRHGGLWFFLTSVTGCHLMFCLADFLNDRLEVYSRRHCREAACRLITGLMGAGKASMDIYIFSDPVMTALRLLLWNVAHLHEVVCIAICFVGGLLIPIPLCRYVIRKVKVFRLLFLGER